MATRLLGVVAVGGIAAASVFGLFIVPADLNQGDAQRIMYVHVSSAWLGYLSFGVTAVAGVAYLVRRDLRFDAVGVASAELAVLFIGFAIWGGMMWGRPVWGVFWSWGDPRLTTTALLLALGIGYLLLRRLIEDPVRRATRAAVAGLVAAVDVPIVHFSVEWWRGLHQEPTIGSPERLLNPAAPGLFVAALMAQLAAFSLAWLWLMIRRYRLARLEWQIEEEGRLGGISAAQRAARGVQGAGPATTGEANP